MKLRIKFLKIGSMKFISHLDLMRYVQKTFRRAGIDVAYSQGYSPHQLLSFAAPLGLGDTSEGDYLDIQVNSMESQKAFLQAVNDCMNDEIQFLSLTVHEDKAKPSMALVAAADYCVNLREGYSILSGRFDEFMSQQEIPVLKKSKRTEKLLNIRPMIYLYGRGMEEFCQMQRQLGGPECPKQMVFEEGLTPICYLRTACGSSLNLKPDLVMEAFCEWLGIEYLPFAFQVHRLETYTETVEDKEGKKQFVALCDFYSE